MTRVGTVDSAGLVGAVAVSGGWFSFRLAEGEPMVQMGHLYCRIGWEGSRFFSGVFAKNHPQRQQLVPVVFSFPPPLALAVVWQPPLLVVLPVPVDPA